MIAHAGENDGASAYALGRSFAAKILKAEREKDLKWLEAAERSIGVDMFHTILGAIDGARAFVDVSSVK